MSVKEYKTLLKRACDEFIIDRSRFIGHGFPVRNEEEALDLLAEMRKTYSDASHNCYAYIIGENKGVMRYSDDGEPGGTAGKPIMQVLINRDVTDCLVVVTRYFGGILLGSGGLVRAYSEGASLAVNASGVGVMSLTKRLLADCPYTLNDRLEHFLKSEPVIVEDISFSEIVTRTLLVKESEHASFEKHLSDAFNGRIETIEVDEHFMAWKADDND